MLLLLWYMYVFILYSVGVLNSTSKLTHTLHKEFIYLFINFWVMYVPFNFVCLTCPQRFRNTSMFRKQVKTCLTVWYIKCPFYNFLEVPKTFYWNILNLKSVKYLSQGLKVAIPSKLPIFLIFNLVIPIYSHKFPTIFISPSHLI